MIQLVAFDLDGTLSQSDSFLIPTYREVLRSMGACEPAPEVLLDMIGGSHESNRVLMSGVLSPEEYATFSGAAGRLAPDNAARYGQAYPGIKETLDALHRMGCETVLCSNAAGEYVEGILCAEGLREKFGEVFPGCKSWNKSQVLGHLIEAYHADAAVMVGDRHFDKEAAQANGIPFIGCLYGLFPEEVRDADITVSDPSEIPAAVEKLLWCAVQQNA